MLIHVHRSGLADAARGGEPSRKSFECIELLLQMHHEGHHIVSLDLEAPLALTPIRPRLSGRAKSALDHVRRKALEIEGLRRRLSFHIELGLGDAFDGKAHPMARGGCAIRAPLHHFDRSSRADQSVLLGENLTDTAFYIELATLRMADRAWHNHVIRYEETPGGGSTMASLFEKRADAGRIILAIADSDREAPDAAPGGTWWELQKKLRKDGDDRPAYQRAKEVHVREAENLIPLDVYDAAFTHGGKRDARLRVVEALRRLSADARAHADLKDELGKQVLRQIVDWLRVEGPRRPRELASLFGFSQDEKLTALCDEVISWGCAFPESLG